MITDDEMMRAIERIALTPDGELLYRYLQRTAQSVLDDLTFINPGALSVHDGKRRFALQLMQRMAKGIDERAGRTDHSARPDRTDQPVVFTGAKPVSLASTGRSIRDRLADSDPELADARRNDPGARK